MVETNLQEKTLVTEERLCPAWSTFEERRTTTIGAKEVEKSPGIERSTWKR